MTSLLCLVVLPTFAKDVAATGNLMISLVPVKLPWRAWVTLTNIKPQHNKARTMCIILGMYCAGISISEGAGMRRIIFTWNNTQHYPRPLFTKRYYVLPINLMKSRSCEIECYNDRFALKFDRHLGSVAAEVPVKFQSNWKSLNPNLAASRLHEILR